MRVDPDGGRAGSAPGAPPVLSSQQRPAEVPAIAPGQAPTAKPLPNDRVDRSQEQTPQGSGGISALRDWAEKEWSTVAGAAHGLASVPGVVSNAWRDAAKTNASLAQRIDSTVDHWRAQTAAQRQVAIDGLRTSAAEVSTTATKVAGELSEANRIPLGFEKALDTAITAMPAAARAPLQAAAKNLGAALSKLPAPVEARARAGAQALETVASAQAAKAATTVGGVSELIGQTVGKAHSALTGNVEGSALLGKVPVLRDTPVVGVLLTGAAVANDVRDGKSVVDALVANVGGTLIGTATGGAVASGLSTIGSAAIVDETAAALGAAAAAGPGGWALAAGVLAAAATGYGVYKVVESQAGQDVIDGLTHLDGDKMTHGLSEARSDVEAAASAAGRAIASHLTATTV